MSKTVDIKELVKRLNAGRILLLRADGDRDLGCQSNITTDTSMALADELKSAADALEALRGEVEKWKQRYFTASAQAIREAEKAEAADAERDRLKAALDEISKQPLITEMSDDDLDAAIEEGYDQCILTARKALEVTHHARRR